MALTHAAIAATGVSFALGDASPLVMGLAIVGSQLPDLDTSESLIGQALFPISRFLESRFPHRSVTHSLLATAAIALLSLPLYFYLGWKIWIALPLGHLIACFSDTFTKQGVQLFWPSPAWAVCGSNPNRRLTTGSPAEYWVLAGAIALLVVSINIQGTGGLIQSASQQLGLKSGVMAAYNKNAATHHIYASITGVWAGDRSDASGKYWILGTDRSEFIVTDGNSIYKTGEQIVTSKLTTTVGEAASTQIMTISFDDEDAVPRLQQLAASYPGAAIFINGSITVDFPGDIKPVFNPDQFQTIAVTASTVKMSYHPIEKAIVDLRGQYAIGTITAKIIQPRPLSVNSEQ